MSGSHASPLATMASRRPSHLDSTPGGRLGLSFESGPPTETPMMSADQPVPIATLLRALRRRWILIALCMILVPLAAVGSAYTKKEVYQASADLLFRSPGFDDKILGNTSLNSPSLSSNTDRTAATNLQLIELP